MLTYLFIITIAYEFIGIIRNIYKYRTRHLSDDEKKILEKNRISPETRENAFVFSIFCCIGITLMSLVGIMFGGAFAIVMGVAFAFFSAVGAAAYTISYSKGINIAMVFVIYNYIMMILFVRSVCNAV